MMHKLQSKALSSTIIVFLAAMLLVMPFQSNLMAQDVSTACADAQRQAQADISGSTWFILGCLFGVIPYIISLQEPNPPATQLLGKSPEYIAMYTDCYRKEGKHIKSKNALTGCLIGTGVTIVLYVILLSAAASETSTQPTYY